MYTCIGAGLIIAGIALGIFNVASSKRLKEADGRVVGYEHTTSDRGGLKKLPIVEFQRPDGKTEKFTHDDSSVIGGTTLHIGQPDVEMLNSNEQIPVKVVYDPNNPLRARIKGFKVVSLGPIILIVIGLGFTIAQFMLAGQ